MIIFDFLFLIEEYIYMIGRVLWFSNVGFVMVFVNDESKVLFKEFVVFLKVLRIVVFCELLNLLYLFFIYVFVYNRKKK